MVVGDACDLSRDVVGKCFVDVPHAVLQVVVASGRYDRRGGPQNDTVQGRDVLVFRHVTEEEVAVLVAAYLAPRAGGVSAASGRVGHDYVRRLEVVHDGLRTEPADDVREAAYQAGRDGVEVPGLDVAEMEAGREGSALVWNR